MKWLKEIYLYFKRETGEFNVRPGYVPPEIKRLEEAIEKLRQGREKCIDNPWAFNQYCVYIAQLEKEIIRQELSSIELFDSRPLDTTDTETK